MTRDQRMRRMLDQLGEAVTMYGGDGAAALRRLEWGALWQAIGDAEEMRDADIQPTAATWHYQWTPTGRWASAPQYVMRVWVELA